MIARRWQNVYHWGVGGTYGSPEEAAQYAICRDSECREIGIEACPMEVGKAIAPVIRR